MNDSSKQLMKNISYLTISTFASKILVFLLVPLYTSVLSTEEYGSYDAVVTTAQFVAPIVIANISDGVMRFLLDQKKDSNQIVKIGYLYLAIGIGVIGILCGINYFTHAIQFLNGFEGYAFLYGAFYILNNHYIQCAKGKNRVDLMATAGVIGTVVMLCSNIICLLVLKWGIQGFYIANILGLAIPTFYYILRLRDWNGMIGVSIDSDIHKQMLKYSMPLVFNTIGWTINSSLDKYCVIYFLGLASSGLLAVAYKIPTILSVIYAIFTQAWQVSAVTEYDKPDRNRFYSDTFLIVNAFGAILCAGLIIGNKILAHFLFSNDFYQAWQYVPFLLLSVMFNQTAGFIGPLLSAKMESNAMAKAAIYGSVGNLILNIGLILIIGIQGAALATAIASFIIYFVRWWYARDLLEKNIYKTIYPTWFLLAISATAEAVGIPYVIQIVCFLVILFVNRKEIIKVVSIVKQRFN